MRRSRVWTSRVGAGRRTDRQGGSGRSPARALNPERGSASLEFITAGLILLVPLVYLVLAMAALQGGALAVEGAARQAARVYVQAPDEATATARADRAVQFGLTDYGIDPAGAEMNVDCEAGVNGCLTRQATVTVTVRIRVALPLLPDLLSLRDSASVPLEAQATQTVSRFWRAG